MSIAKQSCATLAYRAMLLCVFCVLTVGADSPENKPLSTQTKWPALYPYPIGAGIQGLASNSTDIIVADVLETHPRKALEGASDNLKIKVVRVMEIVPPIVEGSGGPEPESVYAAAPLRATAADSAATLDPFACAFRLSQCSFTLASSIHN